MSAFEDVFRPPHQAAEAQIVALQLSKDRNVIPERSQVQRRGRLGPIFQRREGLEEAVADEIGERLSTGAVGRTLPQCHEKLRSIESVKHKERIEIWMGQ